VRVLVVGAHPDDYELGAGMRLMHHVSVHDDVVGVICSRGDKTGDASTRITEAVRAAEIIGLKDLYVLPFDDTRLPDVGTIKDRLEEVVAQFNPALVYGHFPEDRHQDHRAVAQATTIACRRIPSILCYQSPSTSMDAFHPHLFHVGSQEEMERKRELIAVFRSQIERADGICLMDVEVNLRFYGSCISRYSHQPIYAEPFCANHFVLNCRELTCLG
jgi:LmbE family N-acetylglucosaminyl deacetylase